MFSNSYFCSSYFDCLSDIIVNLPLGVDNDLFMTKSSFNNYEIYNLIYHCPRIVVYEIGVLNAMFEQFEQSIKVLQASWSGTKRAHIVTTKRQKKNIKEISIFLIPFVSLVLWTVDEAERTHGMV